MVFIIMAKKFLLLDEQRLKTLADRLSEIKEFSVEHCQQAASFLSEVYGNVHMKISDARKKISSYMFDKLRQNEYIAVRNDECMLGMSTYIVIDPRIGCSHYIW